MNEFSREIEILHTDYNTVHVIESADGAIDFDVIGATHATWHPRLLLTGHAWDAITAATLMGRTPPESLLLLGLGGGTVLRQLRFFLPDTRMTAVEIDPGMIRLARTHMAIDELDLEIIQDDAYAFLQRDTRRFDRVIDDLYRCGDTDVERPAPVTTAGIRALQEHLKPDGCLIMNFVLGGGHRKVHQAGRKAFSECFDHVRAIQPPLSHNEILVGTRAPEGLRAPRDLQALWAQFPAASDQKRWKELRNLKLR
ncbi:MAG: fused MFS/spermidine synthase [Verrucomicrobia bacterium]|nr:fused MFS/spermidine synthase [Verrucomicrobiota bacterium]MCH8526624.1 fused MFS/spermidine synthase [Kiritimatiellia bacterium]